MKLGKVPPVPYENDLRGWCAFDALEKDDYFPMEKVTQRAADLAVCTCENPRSHYYDKGICPDCGLPFSPNI